MITELRTRGANRRESGCFLLGKEHEGVRFVERVVYYDDLDAHCLDSGGIDFNGAAFETLWTLCETSRLTVVADVHTHPGAALQSVTDATNPAISIPGHVAFIVPNFGDVQRLHDVGMFIYSGRHWWQHVGDNAVPSHLQIAWWL